MANEAVTPVGINHLVLNVRNIEESHRFWTETIGFKQVGEIHATPKRPNPPKMRFYSGDHGAGAMSHHDIALIENPNLPAPPAEWSMSGGQCAISHQEQNPVDHIRDRERSRSTRNQFVEVVGRDV